MRTRERLLSPIVQVSRGKKTSIYKSVLDRVANKVVQRFYTLRQFVAFSRKMLIRSRNVLK